MKGGCKHGAPYGEECDECNRAMDTADMDRMERDLAALRARNAELVAMLKRFRDHAPNQTGWIERVYGVDLAALLEDEQ